MLRGNGGPDRIYGGTHMDILRGGPGNDRLTGGTHEDRMFGIGGDDVLNSRDSYSDVVRGGPGNDGAKSDDLDRLSLIEYDIP
jgi:Ca2+-binding RTX toxin-like protein